MSQVDPNKSIGNIRNVLEQVKSGKIDKSVAYNELRDILHQAVNKRSKDVEETESYLQGTKDANNNDDDENITIDSKSDNSSITRFTKEERQLIINKLIEKKRLDRRGINNQSQDQDFDQSQSRDQDNLSSPFNTSTAAAAGGGGRNYASNPPQRQRQRGGTDQYFGQMEDNVSSVMGGGSDQNQNFEDDWIVPEQDPNYDYLDNTSSRERGRSRSRERSRVRERSNSNNNSDNNSQGRSNSNSRNNNNNINHSYYDSYEDTNHSSMGRSNRILRTEAAIREEMFKDCTFHPNIRPLPDHYGQPKYLTTPFLQRVNKWQKEKSQQVQRLKNDFDRISTQDCSFHPVINRHSYKAMQELRAESQETAAERLYREAKSSTISKNKFLDDEMRMQEEINRQLCTFRPNLQTRGAYQDIGPKYAITPDKSFQKPQIVTREMKECTFTPKIKGVRPSMNSAKLYLSEKVVDRLSKPMTAMTTPNHPSKRRSLDDSMVSKSYDGISRVMDVASFMSTGHDNRGRSMSRNGISTPNNSSYRATSRPRSHSAPRERRLNNNNNNSTNNTSTDYDDTMNQSTMGRESLGSAERKSQFESFLLRQKFSVEQKSRKLTEKAENLRPNFQPELCKKSKQIVERTATGEFLERLDRDVLHRKEKLVKYEQAKDLEHSFTPAINEKSIKLRPRSSYEMSRGDLLRKETNHRMNRLKQEQEQASELTFRPEITRKASTNAKSVIKSVTENTSQFLEWYHEKQKRMEDKRREISREKEVKELEECTFTPITRDCPAYVKRIAKSMEIVRAARASSQNSFAKPAWQ